MKKENCQFFLLLKRLFIIQLKQVTQIAKDITLSADGPSCLRHGIVAEKIVNVDVMITKIILIIINEFLFVR